MIYPIVIAIAIAATASANLYVSDHTQQKFMWETFKQEHRKNYETMDEETQRFGFFLENLKIADHRNEREKRAGGTAVHGITKFSDLSQAEFESRYLTADVRMKPTRPEIGSASIKPQAAQTGNIDWSGILTTPVKDQGYCGSCWAFSATEQIESDSMRTLGTDYILSPEQITQCDTKAFGCGGGWTESAYAYVKSTGGIETDSDYPYTSYQGVTGSCHSSASQFVIKVSGFTSISGSTTSEKESNMANYMLSTGPLSVCLDASSWNSYTGGIMSVCGNSVDHCVQAVGVDNSASSPFWKVRNSWGTSWGESGYIQLAYGQNTCDITNDPTWVTTTKA